MDQDKSSKNVTLSFTPEESESVGNILSWMGSYPEFLEHNQPYQMNDIQSLATYFKEDSADKTFPYRDAHALWNILYDAYVFSHNEARPEIPLGINPESVMPLVSKLSFACLSAQGVSAEKIKGPGMSPSVSI
ncbi:MAG: hypothetical protein JWO78_1533 [Micavibrio sp.]|nr:hypothetical protein [Micavibrio sp.]